jgi:hypothetical protein
MRLEGHVASMGDNRSAYRVWLRYLREGDHLKDLDVDGRTILKCIVKN